MEGRVVVGAVFVEEAGSPIVEGSATKVGDGALFAIEDGSVGGVAPCEGNLGLVVAGLADKGLVVGVVIPPWLGGGVVGVGLFGNAG